MESSGNVTVADRTGEDAAAGAAPAAADEAQRLWSDASAMLKEQMGHAYARWLGRSRALTFDQEQLLIAVPSLFVKDWVENRYTDLLRSALERAAGREIVPMLVTDETLSGGEPEPEAYSFDTVAEGTLEPQRRDPTQPHFHPKYSFESFVIGASNRFAHAAALAVAEAPAGPYNPLFIYGGAGLGKTHLLHAIGRYVCDFHPELVVRYVSTEQFMNDFIVALQRRTIPDFHRHYRAADVLLVDDVQFLEGKERTQEEFFHTFNALHPKSQVVLTSDRPPKKVSTLEERLRTRFEWGLITDIQPPDLETRLAILRKKCETERLYVNDEVLGYIADRIQTNIRELEGALIRVAAYASLTRSDITLEVAEGVLHSLLPHSNEARIGAELIISVAADYFAITPDEICSQSRSRPLVTARQVAMYLCRELTDLTLPGIGKRFGNRDHSTVIFAIKKISAQMKERAATYDQVRELTERIRQHAART